MDIYATFERAVREVVTVCAGQNQVDVSHLIDAVVVETPKDPSHGDLSTNAAMVCAKAFRMAPRVLAERLASALESVDGVRCVDIAGPGFLNLWLDGAVYISVLQDVLVRGADVGRGCADVKQRVNIEYVSANPTGPMHIGHCRGAVVGDVLAGVMAYAGHDVTREYYINDAGGQIDVLARSLYHRYLEARGCDVEPLGEGLYPGDYLVTLGQDLASELGDEYATCDDVVWMPVFKKRGVDAMMGLIRDDLAALRVHHDVFTSEQTLHAAEAGQSRLMQAIDALDASGHVYLGTLPPPKGVEATDWVSEEQTLFRSTVFGDDVDRAILKADGTPTYFSADIAYHKDKIDRGFDVIVDVLGADHAGYLKRLEAVCLAFGGERVAFSALVVQLVKLMRGGEVVKMSKRSGDFVTLREVVDEVGADAVRFMMVMRKADASLDFDLIKVLEQTKDNPVFYVQYAHARICSVFQKAQEQGFDVALSQLKQADLTLLSHSQEAALLSLLAQFPRIVRIIASRHEVHRLPFYLYDLASQFQAYYTLSKDDDTMRFVRTEDLPVSYARLALIEAVRIVLKSGLDLLGVSAPEEMR